MAPVNSRPSVSAMTARGMVEKHIKPRGIGDERVLSAMERVPRHLFVPEGLRERAYGDNALPLGEDQTISQPYIVALMSQELKLTGSEKILEIGTGSGYQTAVLAELAKSVFSIERLPRLASKARERLEHLGHSNVSIRAANGILGWREYAPFDRILVTAAARVFPEKLFEQVGEGGGMIVPIGNTDEAQELTGFWKIRGKPERRFICTCSFVPFVV